MASQKEQLPLPPWAEERIQVWESIKAQREATAESKPIRVKLPDGNVDNNKAESWTVERSISMSFAANAPAGVSPTGYGSTVLAGTYREAITGLRRNGAAAAQSTHNVEGTFLLRRVSDTATYSKP